MIKVDISKALPPSAFDYLAAFVPGLFFEISILLANPKLVHELAVHLQQGFGVGYYVSLFIFLVVAFIIGNAFLLFVSLIQWLFGYLYLLKMLLRKQFINWALTPMVNWCVRRPWWNKRRWVGRLQRYVHQQLFQPGLREVQRVWHRAATVLLHNRYGIAPPHGEEWGVWYGALEKPTATDMRGSILIMGFHATGWCGIVATYFAPVLKSRSYLVFSSFLIFSGVCHDWFVAKRKRDPLFAGMLRIRDVLAQLREMGPKSAPDKSAGLAEGTISLAPDDE